MSLTEPSKTKNGEVATVMEARRCRRRVARRLAKVVQMLEETVGYVRLVWAQVKRVMTWSL